RFIACATLTPPVHLPQSTPASPRLPRVDDAPLAADDPPAPTRCLCYLLCPTPLLPLRLDADVLHSPSAFLAQPQPRFRPCLPLSSSESRESRRHRHFRPRAPLRA